MAAPRAVSAPCQPDAKAQAAAAPGAAAAARVVPGAAAAPLVAAAVLAAALASAASHAGRAKAQGLALVPARAAWAVRGWAARGRVRLLVRAVGARLLPPADPRVILDLERAALPGHVLVSLFATTLLASGLVAVFARRGVNAGRWLRFSPERQYTAMNIFLRHLVSIVAQCQRILECTAEDDECMLDAAHEFRE